MVLFVLALNFELELVLLLAVVTLVDTMELLVVEVGVDTFCPPPAELSFGMGGRLEILFAFGLRKLSTDAAVSCVMTLFLLDEVDLSRSLSRLLELSRLDEPDFDFSRSDRGEDVLPLDEEDKLLLEFFSSFEEPDPLAEDELKLLEWPGLADWGTGEFLPLGPCI